MDNQQIIEQFSQRVNRGLATGEDVSDQAYAELEKSLTSPADRALLDLLRQTFQAALNPDQFVNLSIEEVNADLDQTYELLSSTFDETVLGPKEGYIAGITARKQQPQPHTSALLARFWQVLGLHEYDRDGNLRVFGFDRLASTRHIASVIGGSYFTVPNRPGEGFAGIGHLATIPARRRGGHARAITDDFERRMQQVAAARSEQLQAFILESERMSRPYWYRMGYRWPRSSVYFQPPMDFDMETGEALLPAVPECLMLKTTHGDSATIQRDLLLDIVRSLYDHWYLPRSATPAAQAAISAYLFEGLLADFAASLPDGDDIPLDEPPA
jgi:hypothetical protein